MARPLSKTLLLWTRTLHIYVTMFGLILLMFFSFTGFVMNHSEFFSVDKPVDRDVDMEVTPALATDKTDDHRLRMVEFLRAHGARGEMESYEDNDEERITVHFKQPGRRMEYEITRADGKTKLHEESYNTMALLADLHQGKSVGPAWHLVIDGSAIFLMFASLSGLVLWISLPKRRKLGIVALAAGIAVCVAVYWMLVP